ncbi:MAG: NAD-dependent epimerase/dehydratase family protein [Chthoniobacteraceae bacterium]
MKKTVLVTGAAGFIGSHLAEALLHRGDRVVGLDNLDASHAPARKQANLAAVESSAGEGWKFVQGDIRDTALITRLFEEESLDAVVHLAALRGTVESIEAPLLHCDVNVQGTLNLLNAAAHRGLGNFVFASTGAVYGDSETIPYTEADPCGRPLTPDGASKRSAEMLGHTFHHLYGLNFTALRLFEVYGPRNHPTGLPFQLADTITSHKTMRLFARGQFQRDWIYIDDAIEGLIAALDRPLGYELINLGGGKPVLVADFIARIEAYAGKQGHFLPVLPPDIDTPSTYADIGKACRLLGYSPAVSLEEGAAKFWQWYEALESQPALAGAK